MGRPRKIKVIEAELENVDKQIQQSQAQQFVEKVDKEILQLEFQAQEEQEEQDITKERVDDMAMTDKVISSSDPSSACLAELMKVRKEQDKLRSEINRLRDDVKHHVMIYNNHIKQQHK